MKVTFFSTKAYDKEFMNKSNAAYHFELFFFETALNPETAKLAEGSDAICIFVNDNVSKQTINALSKLHIKLIALRCAGFNNVDLKAAKEAGIKIVRVPAYSPYAVAEHTLAMILTLNRKTHTAYNRIRNGNFSLERLMGFDLRNKTVGVIGTGTIGKIFAEIAKGVGCKVIAYDLYPDTDLKNEGIQYVTLAELYKTADIISLHCPLTAHTKYIINEKTIALMKNKVMLINTSRGSLVNTQAVINGLKNEKIGYFGMDVYEQEENLFFEDLSGSIIKDDMISRLMTFPNVLITAHQAFFTEEAITNIADTTLKNLSDFKNQQLLENEVLLN
ncbi:2-hydroxyacid dehydrogenase [Zhouia sp. PK063]|uniref:2-hydroxyacid dehydrogenase n=1 Tax=Zhouia sp. PK063 TaxID=3373602 RepID=UPI0037B3AE37